MYTPKKQILREMKVNKRVGWWDKEYSKRDEILRRYGVGVNYTMNNTFKHWFPITKFFSKSAVKNVPVNGFLFPVEMFEEIKVQ
jgi:hypothetical protein